MTTAPADEITTSECQVTTVAEGATWVVRLVVPPVGEDFLPWYEIGLGEDITGPELARAALYVHPDYRLADFDGRVMFFEAD